MNYSPKKRHRSSSDDGGGDEANNSDDDEDDDDEYEQQPLRKRIRRIGLHSEHSRDDPSHELANAFHRKTRDRLARKAFDIEADPKENTSYQRFIELLDVFNDDYERYREHFDPVPDEHYLDLLLSDSTLDELSVLAEKLKLSTYMSHIDLSKLKRLLEILSLRIRQGVELSPALKHDADDTDGDEVAWRNLMLGRLTVCANACEVALDVMTTSTMPREILLEDIIEHTALFVKAQLAKTIFPEYDPLYRNDNQSKGRSSR